MGANKTMNMCRYIRKMTTPEVWAVIKARHHDDLVVFDSFSAPYGNAMRNQDEGLIETEYGFYGAPYPFMVESTRWDIDHEQPHKRLNERHQYWLCIPDNREVERLRTAIQNCLDWTNGRETEWGERAENAFQFLYDAVEQEAK